MVLVLRERLQQVEELLGLSLFTRFWQGVADALNHFLYQEVTSAITSHFLCQRGSLVFYNSLGFHLFDC